MCYNVLNNNNMFNEKTLNGINEIIELIDGEIS